MKVKNTSNKIINFGTEILLPDAEMEISAIVASTPAVKAMERVGILTLTETAVASEDVAEEVVEEPVKKTTRTRKAKIEAPEVSESAE